MIPTNVFNRVFHLQVGESAATGFAIDVDGKSYLVTARHFAQDVSDGTEIRVHHDKQWKPLKVRVVGHAPGEIDISVLAPPFRMTHPDLSLPADMGGLIYGQDVFFLGYPYDSFGDLGEFNFNYPMPFVKKAVVSCVEVASSGACRVFLDGHNNPGFSGGPVVFKESGGSSFKIASVISGYQSVNEPVYQGETKLPITYRYNTGIIISYGVRHAVELDKRNPIGPPVIS
jgi:hypothetical protein